MTEQQIREQTQAVFDAYLMISRNGISLSDFLEIRREAIQELAAVTDTVNLLKKETDNPSAKTEKKKKKPQKETAVLAENSASKWEDENGLQKKTSSADRKTENPAMKVLAEEDVSVGDAEEELEEAVMDDSDDAAEEYSDFLDEFQDPWN